jgi:hypothetical protein
MWILGAFLVAARRVSGTRILALGVVALLIFALLTPQPAFAQFGGLAGLLSLVNQAANSILNFITGTMGPLLQGIQSAAQALQSFLNQLLILWEQVVWPASQINGAHALAQQLIGTFRALLNNLYATGVNSAQLPNPIQLEGVMRDHQVNDHAQLVASFQQTYGTLPLPADAHPEERNLIDADDALAIDQLMTLKMADAAADQMIQAAQAIEDESTRTAPGTAAMLSAAAYIASVESQAYMQKMLAGQLRQEAARLAHDTMSLKRSAWFARDSRNNITDLNR